MMFHGTKMSTRKKSSKPKKKSKRNGLIADDELARLQLRLNKKRDYIAILELELFNTRASLFDYQALYNERLLPLEQTLRRLRRLLYEIIHDRNNGNGNEEDYDFSEPDDEPLTYQEKAEAEWRNIGKQAKVKKNPHIEAQIRELFRQLAKRFHPDLTSDPKEKKFREAIMAQVNKAYAHRDLKKLQQLAEQPDIATASVSKDRAEEILHLRTELVRLDGVIAELKGSLRHLEESPAMKLLMEARMQRRNGKDLLTEMESKLQEQIDSLQERLIVSGMAIEKIQDALKVPQPEPELGD
jgi:hypothetical protein